MRPDVVHDDGRIGSEKITRNSGRSPAVEPPAGGSTSATVGGTVSRMIEAPAVPDTLPARSRTRAHSRSGPSALGKDHRTVGAKTCQGSQFVPSVLNCMASIPDRSSVATTVALTAGLVVAGAPPPRTSVTRGGPWELAPCPGVE